ncbi:MAG: HIT family protein [Corynebacterium sp.]|uniref:HIT family protein n=1 Tax=Corynebacterium sp. TaxID=1720 RepID=UPI0026DBE93C|nr:HIT family protein [Corynebacterium sp.]MDO5097149.1 HIT family protein [Corynebacterium sp.]
MSDWRNDRIGSAIAGENPMVIAELDQAFVAIGDTQFLPGYCVVLTKQKGVNTLSDLPKPERMQFLADLDLAVSAIENVCKRRDDAFRRVNIEILGNLDPFLHAHIFPRFNWEGELTAKPVWMHPSSEWTDPNNAVGPAHDELRAELRAEIERLRG